MTEYQLFPYFMGTAFSGISYALSLMKGAGDIIEGRDTFFSRAAIPVVNIVLKKIGKNPINYEVEFQEFLRIKRENGHSKLESEVKGK